MFYNFFVYSGGGDGVCISTLLYKLSMGITMGKSSVFICKYVAIIVNLSNLLKLKKTEQSLHCTLISQDMILLF